MNTKRLYKLAGLFAAGIVVLALALNPQAAGAAIAGAFALIGTVLAELSGMAG